MGSLTRILVRWVLHTWKEFTHPVKVIYESVPKFVDRKACL